MIEKQKQYKYGLVLLVPLVLSMLFIGISNYTSANSDDGLDLNQVEIGSSGGRKIHLRLFIDGNEIEGESTVASLDREGTIECDSFRYALQTPREQASGALTGRRQHSPIVITKKIDKTSPLLFKALAQNEPVSSAEFRFYRPSSSGAGSEEHYYTVLIENGYISSFNTYTLTDFVTSQSDMVEEVHFVFQRITIIYEIGGATHQDDWQDRA